MSDPKYDFDLGPLVQNALLMLRGAMAGLTTEASVLGLCKPGRDDQLTADVFIPWDWQLGPGLAQVDLSGAMTALVKAVPEGWEITDRAGSLQPFGAAQLQLPIGPPAAAYAEHKGIGIRGVIAEMPAPNHPKAVVMPFYDLHHDDIREQPVITVLRFDVRIRPIQQESQP